MRNRRMRFAERKQERIENLEASVAYFESANKAVRERDSVIDFLKNIGPRFRRSDVRSVPDGQDPPDVRFDLAAFEVKEMLDPGRKRHAEYKAKLEAARRARTYKELWALSLYNPRDITVSDLLDEVEGISVGLVGRKYPVATTQVLDLLIYYDLIDVMGLIETPFPTTGADRLNGWRSVSVVMGYRAIVFRATPDAPRFLRRALGCIRHRPG
jgi:Putative endonuclease, protein of unknown function (DUF1780)